MLEVIVGFIILTTPYLLGCILNILVYGFDFACWEGFSWTYAFGICILMFLSIIGVASYYIGHFILSIIN